MTMPSQVSPTLFSTVQHMYPLHAAYTCANGGRPCRVHCIATIVDAGCCGGAARLQGVGMTNTGRRALQQNQRASRLPCPAGWPTTARTGWNCS